MKVLALTFTLLGMSMAAGAQTKSASVLAGIDAGGLALGANLDIADTATESFGGYARVFAKDRDEGEAALFAIGASVRGQIRSGIFEYYILPGFGAIQHNFESTKWLIGPSLGIGATAELDKSLSIGFENSKLYSWVGKYKGLMKDAFLAQLRFTFP